MGPEMQKLLISLYRKTMNTLGTKLEEYWKEIRHKRNIEDPNNSIPVEDTKLVHFAVTDILLVDFLHALILLFFAFLCVYRKRPDQNWTHCDDCLKWRKLPDGIDCDKLPDKWFCRMNPDPQYR